MRTKAAPAVLAAAAVVIAAATGVASPSRPAARDVTVRFASTASLAGLHVKLRIDHLHEAVVTTHDLAGLRVQPGIVWADPTVARRTLGSAPTVLTVATATTREWQFAATRSNTVPQSVRRGASKITIAIIDTGADLTAPSLAAKRPVTYSVLTGASTVTDTVGHGTFVASLAGGSSIGASVFTGFGGEARLMLVQAYGSPRDFTDANEAAAIVWAVDHGARIVNLSVGGFQTSRTERDAIDYAEAHGVLLVAAAGNDAATTQDGPIYPAALLGDSGLVVGASTRSGRRASFSPIAPYLSLLAPGVNVLGAVSSSAPARSYPRLRVADPRAGLYGYGTGTSYAAPEVAGAAALLWAANARLSTPQVIQILESTASNAGSWTPGIGYGVIDVGGAVALALGQPAPPAGTGKPIVITLVPKR